MHSFEILGCDLSFFGEIDMDKQIDKLNHMCGTTRRTLNGKVGKDIFLKFYKVMAVLCGLCGLYGSEASALNAKTHIRIKASKMRFF